MGTRAIFLGTFDPPHNGHVNCIKSVINSPVMKKLNIEKIHIIPCYQNPNKKQSTDYWHRYKMCQLEFMGLSDFVVIDDIEDLLQKTDCQLTYTYQLINYLKGGHDELIDANFWWIITHETFQELKDGKWKHSEDLLEHNRFIIVVPTETLAREYLINEGTSQFRKIVLLNNDPEADKHSTQLREKLANGDKCYPYLNLGVHIYINEHNLYK